jgi:hypothetical protein
MGLDEKKKEASKIEPVPKIPNSKRINIVEEYEKRSKEKSKLNLIVIGIKKKEAKQNAHRVNALL